MYLNSIIRNENRGGLLKMSLPVLFSFFCMAYGQTASAFDCLIEPLQIVELGSPASGLLDKVYVKRADQIKKGQILATLESRAEQAAVQLAHFKSEQVGPMGVAQSKINFSKRKFARRQALAEQKFLAMQESDDAESELRLAESELKVATENRQLAKLEYLQQNSQLNLRTIRSPLDGVVMDQLAYPGEVIESGSSKKAVLKVAQLHPLQVHVVLPKSFFGKISVDMMAEVTSELQTANRYTARVKAVDKVVDAASGTFVVLLDLPNPKLEIPAGIRCQANIKGIQANK